MLNLRPVRGQDRLGLAPLFLRSKCYDGVLRVRPACVPWLSVDRDPSELVLVLRRGVGAAGGLRSPRNPGPGARARGARAQAGRPKLGVTSREVTLLPRHWRLARAKGSTGISGALRRLVEDAIGPANSACGGSRPRSVASSRVMAGDRPNSTRQCDARALPGGRSAVRGARRSGGRRTSGRSRLSRWRSSAPATSSGDRPEPERRSSSGSSTMPTDAATSTRLHRAFRRARVRCPLGLRGTCMGRQDARPGAYRERVEYSRRAFPDLEFTVDERSSPRANAVSRCGGARPGRTTEIFAASRGPAARHAFAGQTFFEVKDGTIRGHWQVADRPRGSPSSFAR